MQRGTEKSKTTPYYKQGKPQSKSVFFSNNYKTPQVKNIVSVKKAPSLSLKLGSEVIANLPIELMALADEIYRSRYMLAFENDWDGEGSENYSEKTWKSAVLFLCNYANGIFEAYNHIIPIPHIYHGPKGSIDIFWKKETFTLLVNFPKEVNGIASFYGDDYSNQRIEGHFNTSNFQTLLFPALIQS